MVLPRLMRLKGHRCFDHLYKEGRRYHQPSILLRVVKAEPRLSKLKSHQFDSKACRCAIAISNKVSKKAVIRNKLRRLLHDHLRMRLLESSRNANKWALFTLKPDSSNKDPAVLLEECDRLLFKAGLIA